MHSTKVPWAGIHELLLDVGDVREPKEFCVQTIRKLHRLIPYDQARVYFINDRGQIDDEFLIGVDKRWSEVYLSYYSRLNNGRYSISPRVDPSRFTIPVIEAGIHDWTSHHREDEFYTDYIKPQGLRYSAGSGFHSADNSMKSVYALDRTSRSGFSQKEIHTLCVLQPHLDNLHKNLFVHLEKNRYLTQDPAVRGTLTRRETEIADLLCNGLTPTKISKKLFISLPTVYKHLANIHAKLHVSNRQELLLKLMPLQ